MTHAHHHVILLPCGLSRGNLHIPNVNVSQVNGEGCSLKFSGSCTGLEVYRMVSHQLPVRKGGKLRLHHLNAPLILHKALQERGIVGKAATLSCTYVPNGLYVAWRAVQGQGLPVSEAELAIGGSDPTSRCKPPPKDLEGLGLADDVIQNLSLERVPCLHILTFGHSFNQSLQGVTLPSRLQSLTFERL